MGELTKALKNKPDVLALNIQRGDSSSICDPLSSHPRQPPRVILSTDDVILCAQRVRTRNDMKIPPLISYAWASLSALASPWLHSCCCCFPVFAAALCRASSPVLAS